MTNKIRVCFFRLFAVFLVCGLAGCARGPQGTEVTSVDPHDFRFKVNSAFAHDDQEAIAAYRRTWGAKDKIPATAENRIELITIAGELLKRDPVHPDDYMPFIKKNLDAKDPEILGSALAALSGARDEESLRVLVMFISDSRMRVAIEATTALDYRYQSAKAEPSRRVEAQTIGSSIVEPCASSTKSPPLLEFCHRNGLQ